MTKEAKNSDLRKVVDDSVMDAVSAASDGLKGKSYGTLAEAIQAAGDEDPFFNPSLSQYREGLVINTDENLCKIKKVNVGRGTRTAWCITAPAGHLDENGKPVYDKAFNFYPSTLRKQIQVSDENGDPVLDENRNPKTCDATTVDPGNEVFAEARKLKDSVELLNYAVNKVFLVGKIARDFGPSNYVDKNGTNVPTGHKMTSAPAFKIIGA